MTDEQKPPVEGEGAPEDENGAEATPPGPPPSTYAGRSRQPDPAEPQQPSGVTDELELLEQEISAEAENGLADLPKPAPPAEPDPESDGEPPARGQTVESDTIVLSDREAAQEAALEGVRARAAAHTTKKPAFPAPVAPPSASPAAAGTAAPPAVPPPALPAQGPGGPSDLPPRPVSPEVGKAPKGRLWLRFLVGSILIVVSMATATAVSGLVLASKLADGLRGLSGVQNQLTAADPSNPQTILILGSDRRPGETDRGRSDTTILLRVSSGHINLLSIPRDLKVPIPGFGTDKFNAAYTYGGPKLTTETVKQLTGLPINVVVNINFTGFADAVNEIGCVYIDVDHHYYHSNVGLSTVDQYSAINIPSGYQRMCGFNALSYVRYRHDDNDLVRSARQQAFLREARAQVPASKFLNDYNGLINIFTKYTTSTIQGTSQLIGLANLFFSARNAQIKEIHFPGDIGTATSTYVTATHAAVKQTVAEFLGTTTTTTAAPSGSAGGGKSPAKKPKPESNLTPQQSSNTLVDASASGVQAASGVTKTAHGHPIGIPVYYPTKLVPGAEFDTAALDGDQLNTRGLTIDGGGGHAYYGYKIVAKIPYGTAGYSYDDYFGFSGTNWRDAPILDNATEERTVNGRDYLLFYDNGRLRQVGWRTDTGSYWVENDLLETITPDQMMGMAESMTKYTP